MGLNVPQIPNWGVLQQLGAGKETLGTGTGPPWAGFDHPRNGMGFPGLGWILQELRQQGYVMFKAFSMHLKEK